MKETVPKFAEELSLLKSIILKSGLTETIKWGTEVYTHQGKNIVGVAGFKNFVALWFYNGVFLKDVHQVLLCSQEGKTKALRKWQFYVKEQINESLILEYVREAIQNEEQGRIWKPQKAEPAQIPALLSAAFVEDQALKDAFELLTPYKQKDYIEHLDTAKREDTKKARLEKMIPLILQGVGLHDKYKKS
ncbi:uncharacterized protein YdeI (YjbR/CyaY-like superfamily) [Pedobacter sp. CAN_A7]|uniref:YdeI/OmpD-associated family protein n=1 Tax=Pedobacter sp. CAN_A7 TaxID=2787722 RepID=UPI0018CB97DE